VTQVRINDVYGVRGKARSLLLANLRSGDVCVAKLRIVCEEEDEDGFTAENGCELELLDETISEA